MKKLITLILVLALCVGVLPMGALAADRKPVPKKVTYENSGDAPTVEVEYEDSGDFKWVEFYLLGDKAKEGDLKGPLGLIDIRGVLYHLLGIQTIDTSNKEQFHKDEKTGLYTARGQLYLGGEKYQAEGLRKGVQGRLEDYREGGYHPLRTVGRNCADARGYFRRQAGQPAQTEGEPEGKGQGGQESEGHLHLQWKDLRGQDEQEGRRQGNHQGKRHKGAE